MGRDKALLPFKGRTLIEHVASQVHQAAGSITLVGSAARYSYFGYPVIEDILPGRGPLSGIHAALTVSNTDWNLIVACDMPGLTAEFLTLLIERARSGSAHAVLPVGPAGLPEPLCAVYNLRAADAIARALAGNVGKVTDALAGLELDLWRNADSRHFHNLNTPEEWTCYSND